jgi:hypothetical protein
MDEGMTGVGIAEFAALAAGDRRLLDRLVRGERICAVTPFRYPGRRGPVVVHLIPGPSADSGPRRVTISDGGGLIKSLEEQGMDLSVDLVVSKTVFHAVKEVEGARVGSAEIVIESDIDDVCLDLWCFLQLIAELLGLRHSKYKDALVNLSRSGERDPDLINW